MSEPLLELLRLREIEERNGRILGQGTLMARAGEVAARYIAKFAPPPSQITVLCGPGGNGGDGWACAGELKKMGYAVCCVRISGKAPQAGPQREAYERWLATGGLTIDDPYNAPKSEVVVDAMLGIGQTRALAGDYLDAAMWFNERQALHISLDCPSGLEPFTGNWLGGIPGCNADITITFLAGKPGLYTGLGFDACGHVHTDNLGVSIPLTQINLVQPDDFRHVLQPRRCRSSKRDFGRCAVIGGGQGTGGAALIAARSALRLGAGAVYVELCESALEFDVNCPELMIRQQVNLDHMDAILIGPGLGFSERAKQRLSEAIDANCPVIFDADALTIIAEDEVLISRIARRKHHTVLTPHSAEAARLLRTTTDYIEEDRVRSARELSALTGAVTVLKGNGTVIANRSSNVWINPTGTPALATAGSGDALAGMLAAMFSQRFELMNATLSAVYLHGAAVEGVDCGVLASEIAPSAVKLLQQWRSEIAKSGIGVCPSLSAHLRVASERIYSL